VSDDIPMPTVDKNPGLADTLKQKVEKPAIDEVQIDLNGTWGLTNYFDTILKHRELAKYRVQQPAWFGILLEIENNSLETFGSIGNEQILADTLNDTLCHIFSRVAGKWDLVVEGPYLKLTQVPDLSYTDPTTYIYRKRDDLKFSKDRSAARYYVINDAITDYFNQHLFEGSYVNVATGNKVAFGKKRQLSGIEGFTTYPVRNYFGTYHPFDNHDVITFEGKDPNSFKFYNWVFSADTLTLVPFETEDGENYRLSSQKTILKKQ
jgi:hypothetical protein